MTKYDKGKSQKPFSTIIRTKDTTTVHDPSVQLWYDRRMTAFKGCRFQKAFSGNSGAYTPTAPGNRCP